MYYITKYIAGQTIEVQKTFSKRYGKKYTRAGPCASSLVAVQEYNLKTATRKLTRILNANFVPNDVYLTLTYARDRRPTPEDAKKQIQAFLRKLRKLFRDEGRELKYVWTTAYGERGAIHHHLVIPTMDVRRLRPLWPYGGCHAEFLYDNGEYSGLASYICRQSKLGLSEGEKLNTRKWSGSRNLIIPPPDKKEVDAEAWREPPKPIKGYIVDVDSIDDGLSPTTGIPYLFYRMLRLPDELIITTDSGQILRGDAARDWLTDKNLKDLQNRKPCVGKLIKRRNEHEKQ